MSPDHGLVTSNPVRLHGFVCTRGEKLVARDVTAQAEAVHMVCPQWGAEVSIPSADWAKLVTIALHLALLAHGIGPGDEVVTPPFTFDASVHAISTSVPGPSSLVSRRTRST